MLKRTIKYEDYNGVEREEDFYFNLSKAELTEMELSQKGGLAEMIQGMGDGRYTCDEIFQYYKDNKYKK